MHQQRASGWRLLRRSGQALLARIALLFRGLTVLEIGAVRVRCLLPTARPLARRLAVDPTRRSAPACRADRIRRGRDLSRAGQYCAGADVDAPWLQPTSGRER